jgi:hypothetical protein
LTFLRESRAFYLLGGLLRLCLLLRLRFGLRLSLLRFSLPLRRSLTGKLLQLGLLCLLVPLPPVRQLLCRLLTGKRLGVLTSVFVKALNLRRRRSQGIDGSACASRTPSCP